MQQLLSELEFDVKDGLPGLALIGGVDISFIKEDEVNACAGYVVWYVP